MADHDKTIMCSVLFLDIVEYSKKPVSGQIALKDGFNAFLSAAIRDIPVDDRIILDTGDGAAISFLGDVADALKVALTLRASLLDEGVKMDPPLLVRIGINLGPVRLVRDINGQPNIVGDGINVAQRVMGFAHPGQILVSRSYYEAVSRMSQEYADMFRFEGSRTDKHVREHEIYAIDFPGEATTIWQKSGDKGVPEITVERSAGQGAMQAARSTFQNASSQQRALYIGIFAGALLLLVAVIVKAVHRPAAPLPQAPDKAVVTQTASEGAAASPKAAEPIAEKKPKAVQPAQGARKQAPAGQEKATRKLPSSTRTLEETTAVDPGAVALVSIAATPWGEVYLDGRMQGVSPPLTKLQVAPGKHEIEIRNTTFPAYTQNIHVKANEEIKIKHKFSSN